MAVAGKLHRAMLQIRGEAGNAAALAFVVAVKKCGVRDVDAVIDTFEDMFMEDRELFAERLFDTKIAVIVAEELEKAQKPTRRQYTRALIRLRQEGWTVSMKALSEAMDECGIEDKDDVMEEFRDIFLDATEDIVSDYMEAASDIIRSALASDGESD